MASTKMITMEVYQLDGVTPLVGATPSWDYYRALSETSPYFADVSPPTIREIGTGADRKGAYGFVPTTTADQAIHWRIDFGASASPRKHSGAFRAEDWNTDLITAIAGVDGTPSLWAARLRILGSATATITDPLAANLTAAKLRSLAMQPLVIGDDWEPRFLVLSAGATVNLTGYTVEAVLRLDNGTLVATRTLNATITGSSPSRLQLELDSQVTDNGPTGTTGRGWFTMRFGHEAADQALLAAAIAAGDSATANLAIRLSPAGAAPKTWLRGQVSILKNLFGG